MARRRRPWVLVVLLVLAGLVVLWLATPDRPAPREPAPRTESVPAPAPVPHVGSLPPSPPPVAPEIPRERRVVCPLSPAPPDGPARVDARRTASDPELVLIASLPAQVVGGALLFSDGSPASTYEGRVVIPGFVSRDARWSRRTDGGLDCPEIALQPAARVTGRVENPGTGVVVSGCGGSAVTTDGTFSLDAVPGRCALSAWRMDGPYEVRSEPVAVVPDLGAPLEVVLSLPDKRQAGLGVSIEEVDDGMRVLEVSAGGAAEQADLHPGDLIVAIEGEDARELDLEAFRAIAIGDVGTDVEFEVIRDGEPEILVVRRIPVE